MHESEAVATVIVPMWKSHFWPLLYSDGVHFNSFVEDWLYLPARPVLFVKGTARNKLFGAKRLNRLESRYDLILPVMAALFCEVFVPYHRDGVLFAGPRDAFSVGKFII